MKKISILLPAMAAFLVMWTFSANAQTVKHGDLELKKPWARATAGMAKNGAAYITEIINHGNRADRLVGAASPVARMVQIHTNLMEGGVMKMRRVDGINIDAGKAITLKPGGYHVMMMGLHAPLKEGDSFPLALTFERAGTVNVTAKIGKVGSMGLGNEVPAHPDGGMKQMKN
ncbi:MAG: copper chaperone PCu(A)C [Rhodospirillales bacterium]|nr:copper chaperone PCu(A)C [Rhodospirillales bacterium]